MKERPILFNSDMIKAVLAKSKTQTRRVVKFPQSVCRDWEISGPDCSYGYMGERTDSHKHGFLVAGDQGCAEVRCPYGQAGDRLWVRETWAESPKCEGGRFPDIIYRATADNSIACVERWCPSIFMPRWASRITLEVLSVRAERVQEITPEDCWAEGIECRGMEKTHRFHATEDFEFLWDSINEKRGFGWDSNPWVWVVEFKKVETAK